MRISDWSSDVCSSDLMLHRVGEGELALGIVALCPAPACRHHGRQVVDGPGQVRWIVDVLAESVVAHADVPPEVEDAALPVGTQAPEPEHHRIDADPDALPVGPAQPPAGCHVVAGG